MGIDKKRPLRVANIIEDGKLGGPQIRIIAAAAAMKNEVDTTVIMPIENSDKFRERCDTEGIKYKAMSISRITKEWRVALRYVFFSIFEIARIVRFLKREKFDLIHVSGGSWQYKGVIAGKLAGIKVLWHLNDTSMPTLFRYLFSIMSPLADGFIFSSERSREYYGDLVKSKGQQFLIPAPVDTVSFDPSTVKPYDGGLTSQLKDKVVIMTVANVNPIKGLECLIKTAADVNKSNSDVCFVVVGAIHDNQKNLYEHLLNLENQLSVKNVMFIGAQSDIKGLLQISDIYLCTSLAESSPIAVWEAMAMGKPVVSTDVGDVPIHVKDGQSGYIVNVDDFIALAERLSRYIQEPKIRLEHGKCLRKAAVNDLDIKLCAKRHVQAYSSQKHFFSQVRDFCKGFDYMGTWCRVHTSLIVSTYKRTGWVCIENPSTNTKIYRQVKGLSNTGFNVGSIEMDYDSRCELGISGKKDDAGFIQCELYMKQASFIEKWFVANWRHPDYTHMVSYRFALLGGILGCLGLVTGLVS